MSSGASPELPPELFAEFGTFEYGTAKVLQDQIEAIYDEKQLATYNDCARFTASPELSPGLIEAVADFEHGALGHCILLPRAFPEAIYFYNLLLHRGKTGFTGLLVASTSTVVPLSYPEATTVINQAGLYNWKSYLQDRDSDLHSNNIACIIQAMSERIE